jgi:spermidine/putrescine-binding protein
MRKKAALLLALLMCVSLAVAGCGGNSGKVTINVLNWGDYIDEDLLDQFTEQTGIEVKYTTMANNEEMLVKLQSPDCIYDVCFPSDYIIEKLIAQNLLHELDKSNIPNLSNIDERFLNLGFDPDNKYSVPYMWGTVGILYNTTMVDDPVDSWSILWNEKYAQKILMYDSMRDTIAVALLYLGKDINTRDAADIAAAQQALIDQKPLVLAYLGDSIKESMINGEAAFAVVYSGDAIWCSDPEEGNPDLAYAVPNEGSNVWFDNIVIPKTSQHTAEAEAFINFLCDAQVAKQNTEYIGYSTPNAEALKLLDSSYIDNPTYNPPQEVLDRCALFHDLGDFVSAYEEAWNNVKLAVG